jgi:hypothetical protein
MVYLVTVTFSWFFKDHFGFLSLKCKSWKYFSSVLLWFTFSLLHSLDFSKFILKIFRWNVRVGNISIVFCRGLPCHCYILLIFQSSFSISFTEIQELEYFSSILSWFCLSHLHSLDFSKFILDFFRWNARVGIFQ